MVGAGDLVLRLKEKNLINGLIFQISQDLLDGLDGLEKWPNKVKTTKIDR